MSSGTDIVFVAVALSGLLAVACCLYLYRLNRRLTDRLAHSTPWLASMNEASSSLESAALLADLANNSADFFWVTDDKGKFLFASEAFETIWGFPVSEIYADGSLWINRIHPEDKPLIQAQLSLRRRERIEVDYRIINKNGDIRWINGRSSPIRDESGLQRVVGAARDITEAKANALAMQETARLLQTAQKTAGFGTWIADSFPAGKLTWSEQSCHIFGIAPEDFDNSIDTFQKLVHPDDLEGISKIAQKAIAERVAYTVEHRIIRPDGEIRWVREYADIDVEPGTGTARLVGMVKDITEVKKLEEQLLQSQKMDAIGTLAGGIAHDFNNILAALSGNLELARLDLPPGSPVTESLDEVARSTKRATELVEQILLFGRQQPEAKVPLNLGDSLNEALSLLRASLPASIKIETSIAPDLPAVLANETQMHQVVVNLVNNAWQAIPESNGVVCVSLEKLKLNESQQTTFRTLAPGTYVRLSVQDNGEGMSQLEIAKIFEPFYSTKVQGKGTGLGLSVVHGIIEAHQGGIDILSAVNGGTTLHIYLPATDLPVAVSLQPAITIHNGAGRSILFLDDETQLVRLADRMLKRLNYRVVVTSEPAEAIQKLKDNPQGFDLLVTDMNMPSMSGLNVAVRAREIRAELPIVIATGNLNADLEARIRVNGIKHILKKPYSMNQLAELLEIALAKD